MEDMKLTFELPTRLSDITVDEYQRYMTVVEGLEKDENGDYVRESENFLRSKMLQIFCGMDLKELNNIPLVVFDSAIEQINFCLNENTPLQKTFVIDGKEFGFIPDLYKISFGEYVDIDSYMKDWKTMHNVMAILFRPIINKLGPFYEIEPYEGTEKYAELMKKVPVDVLLGAMLFFYRLGIKLAKNTAIYSLKDYQARAEMDTSLEQKFLDKHGVGTSQYMQSLKEIFVDFMRLPSSDLRSALLG